MLRLAPIAPTLLLTLALAACGGDGDAAESESEPQVKAVTTLSVFADLVREIGGDRLEVSSLLPAGADPHTFEPVPRDVQRLTEASIVFANGLDLEPGALRVIEPNLSPGAPLIQLGEEAIKAGIDAPAFDSSGTDPHLWLSVDNAREYARIIRDALGGIDPEGARQYEQNYQRYLAELDELAQYVRDKVSAVPPGQRTLVTTHDGFGHMADYLGFQIAAFVAESPGQDPSPRDIADLTHAISDQAIPAVFTEPQIGAGSRLLEQVAADTGVRVCTLYSGALDSSVPTYIEMMRFNADELLRCLGDANG